jgi:chemotaxis protein MotB
MASTSRRRRRRGGGHAEHENEERWLLTYADMITLLMALFMVLFSISSVNISKYKSLQKSLQEAFSGRVLPGGKQIRETGASEADHSNMRNDPVPPIPAIKPVVNAVEKQQQSAAAQAQEKDFQQLKKQIDQYAHSHGLSRQIETTVARRGLVIRLLTDRVLFDSGQAALKPGSHALLGRISGLLRHGLGTPIQVEGYTDNVPIRSSQFPTNWELSTARATSVVRYLIGSGVTRQRLSAAGYADLHPVASNGAAGGRSRNRRVEIVLQRTNNTGDATADGGDAPETPSFPEPSFP